MDTNRIAGGQADRPADAPAHGMDGSVNRHYLNKVLDLADVMPVVATEDIYDSHGMKLLAKGAGVSRLLQEKIILHKLKKPIESTLVVEGGVDATTLVRTAKRVIDTCAPLDNILRATCIGGFTPLTTLSNMSFGNAITMMLTISERDGSQAFEHALIVSLLSICWAKKLHLTEQEQQIAGLAGLLHDVGEIYIEPAYLIRQTRLLPHQWTHVVVHPRIGQMLIADCEKFPAGVGRAVAEHHERYDGGGYPRRLHGNQISAPGQVVGMAELVGGLLASSRSLERAELAIKIFPGEHEHGLLSAISGSLHLSRLGLRRYEENESAQADDADADDENLEHLYERMSSSLACARKLLEQTSVKSPQMADILTQSVDRIRAIERAFVGTGMDVYLSQSSLFSRDVDDVILFEKEVVTREIQWRLRCLARDLTLRSEAKDDSSIFSELIGLLDDRVGAVAALD